MIKKYTRSIQAPASVRSRQRSHGMCCGTKFRPALCLDDTVAVCSLHSGYVVALGEIEVLRVCSLFGRRIRKSPHPNDARTPSKPAALLYRPRCKRVRPTCSTSRSTTARCAPPPSTSDCWKAGSSSERGKRKQLWSVQVRTCGSGWRGHYHNLARMHMLSVRCVHCVRTCITQSTTKIQNGIPERH